VIFARAPECEAASKHLPLHRATRLFRSVLRSWVRVAERANAVAIVAGPVTQVGNTFGERLANSVESVFSLGYEAVVVTGIDVPPPPALDSIFSLIEAGHSVVAPAHDGGVNLLGLRSPSRDLLLKFAIGDVKIADRCRAFFSDLVEMPAASDIDSIHDLLRCEDRLQPVVISRLKPALTLFLAAAGDTRAPPAG